MNRRKNREMMKRILSALLAAAIVLQCIADTGISAKAASVSEWEVFEAPWEQVVAAAYGNDTFLVLDREGRIFSSPDGAQWEECGKINQEEYGFYDISMCFFHDYFYLTGSGDIFLYSADGKEWEKVSCDADGILQMDYGQERYYALFGKKVTESGCLIRMENTGIYTSENGTEWTVQEIPDGVREYAGMAVGGNQTVLLEVTDEGSYIVSRDASGRELCRVQLRTKETPMKEGDAVYYTGGCFLAVCGGRCYRSNDGIEWEDCGPASYLENSRKKNLVFCEGEAYLYAGSSVYHCVDITEGTVSWYKDASYVYGSGLVSGNDRLLIPAYGSVHVKRLSAHTTKDAFEKEKEWESEDSPVEVSGNEIPEKLTADISVSGNCILDGKNIDLNGHTMTVQGDLIQMQGDICLNGGTLSISGSYLTEGGLLIMQKPEEAVIVSGSYLNTSGVDARGYMTEGLMQIGGDFTVTEEAGEYAFATSRNHTVELCGESVQNVSIQKESGESAFTILILSNQSEQGIHFENDPYVSNQIRDNAAHIEGRISVGKRTAFADNRYGGDVINIETVKYGEALSIGGSYFVSRPVVITGNVTVDGTVSVEKSGIVMQRGSLEAGNLEVMDGSYGISMGHGEDTVIIKGNMTWGGTYDDYYNRESRLLKGKMYVAGDVSLGFLFCAEGDHTLILNGSTKQTVKENGGEIGTLELQNESSDGVWSEDILRPKKAVYNGCRLNYGEGNTEGITGFTLEEDRVMDGDVYLMDGTIDLNGYALTINGNLTQASGMIDVNAGTLRVGGDYQMLFTENGGTKSDRTSYGILKMTEPDDYVIVEGDMTVGTSEYLGDYLTDGTLELHGNFSQVRYDNFAPTGNHVTYLAGKKDADGNPTEQYSSFQSSGYGIRYNILLLNIDYKDYYRYSKRGSAQFCAELRYTKDKTPPTMVTNLKAECHTYCQADLSWDAASDNVGVSGYAVFRNGEQIGVTTETAYTDTGLAFGDYTYQVYAYDEEGNQASDSPRAELEIKKDVTPPKKVAGLYIYTRSGSSITLKWNKASDDYGVAGYDLYRDGSLVAENIKEPVYKDSGLVEGKIYEYAVTAKDAEGNTSEMSSTVRAQVFMPRITGVSPKDRTEIGGAATELGVYYANSGNSTENRVRIEYYDDSTNKWVRLNTEDLGQNVKDSATFVSSFVWEIPDFKTEREMSFRYTVIDCDGNEASETVTYFVDRIAPSMPQALAVEENNGVALLKWEKATADDVETYRIERRLKGETDFVFLALTASDVCSYKDTQGLIGKTYEYRVFAEDNHYQKGNPTNIAETTITPDLETPEVTFLSSYVTTVRGSVSIKAQAVDNRQLAGFRFYVRKSDEENWKLLGDRAAVTGTASQVWDTTEYEDGYYYFKAIAYDGAGNEAQNPLIHTVSIDNTGISKIVLKEYKNVMTSARLVWEEPAEDDFSHYVLQKKTGAYWSNYALIQKGTTEYLIRNLAPGISHSFRIVGYDNPGNAGEPSEEISFVAIKDTEAPVIESVSPKTGAYPEITGLSMTVRDSGGIDYGSFSYSRDGKSFVKIADVFVESLEEEAEITYNWNTSFLPEGEITVRFQAADMSKIQSAATDMTYVIDRTPPKRIDSLATAAGGDSILLSWAGNGEDVSHYRIYRTDKENQTATLLADHVTDTFYRDQTADPSLVYFYQISAVDLAGNESLLSERIPGGAVEDTEPPSKVMGLSMKTRTGSSITVEWKEAADNYAVTGYNVYRDGILVSQNVKGTEYKDAGLSQNTLYTYTVTALDKAGNESEKSEGLDGAVFMPKIVEILPQDYAVLGGAKAEFTVRFADAGNSTGNHVTAEYYRPDTDKWEKITAEPIGQQRYNDTTLQASCTWMIPEAEEDLYVDVRFTVTDADGNKTEQTVSYEIDKTPPQAPKKLKAEESDGTIILTWEPSESTDTQGYYIYRKADTENVFVKIGSAGGRMSGWYVDRTVADNTGYAYRVSAYDTYEQEGEPCPQAETVSKKDDRTPQIEEMTPKAGKVSQVTKISVSAHDNRAVAEIFLYLKKDGEEQWKELARVTAENDTASYDWDTSLFADGGYYIKAVAADTSGNESEKEFLRHYTIDNTGPAKIILADCTATASSIQLTWQDVTEEDFGYFAVEQYTEAGWKEIGKVTDRLGYTVTGLLPETEYTYRVVGYDELDNRGRESDEITLGTAADEICPVIETIHPISSSYGDILPLSMQVSDNIGVKQGIFYYSLDGQNFIELATVETDGKDTSAVISYQWDISDMQEGEVTIRFLAFDKAGLRTSLTPEGKEIENTYTIDHTPPEKVTGLAVRGSDGSVELIWDESKEEDIHHFKIWRSQKEEDGYVEIQGDCQTKNYIDADVKAGNTYYYRVSAVDVAGNAGEASESTAAIVRPDKIAPIVYGISPKEGSVIGKEAVFPVLAADNTRLQKVVFSYREKGGLNPWKPMVEQEISGSEYYGEIEWDASNLKENTEYEVRAYAVDEAGNESEPVVKSYSFDLTPPKASEIELESGSFRIIVDKDETASDVSRMELYRKEAGEAEFTCIMGEIGETFEDTTVETDTVYSYKLRVYDEAGNYTDSQVASGYANSIDTIAPVAVLPETIMAMEGETVAFDGTQSTDNVRICRYEWRFGDGTRGSGPRPEHKYKKKGSYTVSLTVYDAKGNRDTAACTVQVMDKDGVGKGTVRVYNEKGQPLAGANIFVKVGNDAANNINSKTDATGKLELMLEEGMYETTVYATGYASQEINIRVSRNKEWEKEVYLTKRDIVIGVIESTRMTMQELVEQGVDLSAPENYNVLKFKVELTFEEEKIPVTYAGFGTGMESKWDKTYRVRLSGTGGGSNEDKNKNEEVHAVVAGDEIKTIMHMSTSQSVKWLKEMYQVQLTVVNVDPAITIEHASATLNVPEGLSLAKTTSGQTMTTNFDTIGGYERVKASWVVRGDTPGSYDISADFHGIIMPFGESFDNTFQTTEQIEIEGGKGIHILIEPEDAYYIGEDYYIQFTVINKADRDFYNFKTSLGEYIVPEDKTVTYVKDMETGRVVKTYTDGGGIAYRSSSAAQCKQVPVLHDGDSIQVGVFSPGEEIHCTYVRKGSGFGEHSTEDYYKLTQYLYECLQGANLGVEVKIEPIKSHIKKYVHNIYIPKPTPPAKPLDSGTGNGDPDAPSYGDPVDTSTGAFLQELNTLSISGGTELSLDLVYNSMMADKEGEAGYGWAHDYEQYIVDEGGVLKLYTSPYSMNTFISQEAQSTVYGYTSGDEVVLEDREYTGIFVPSSPLLDGTTIEKKEDLSGYVMTQKDGMTYLFGKDGKLKKMSQKDGKSISFARKEGTLTVKDDISGESITLTYKDNRIESVQDSRGRICRFSYKNGNLVSYENAKGQKTTFEYDNNHHMCKVINPLKTTVVENTYDGEGRVKTQKEAGSNKSTKFQYADTDGDGLKVTVTNRLEHTSVYETDAKGNLIRYWDENEHKTEYIYNKNGDLTTEIAPDNSRQKYAYDGDRNLLEHYDAVDNVTEMDYDTSGNLRSISDENDNVSYYTYYDNGLMKTYRSPTGILTTYEYDKHGFLTKETTEGLGTKQYKYKNGRMISSTDYNGKTTTYAYDDFNNIRLIRDPLGHETAYNYDALGNLESVTNAEGVTTTYAYDEAGNKKSEATGDHVISYEYYDDGKLKTVTNAKGDVTTYIYDAERYLKEIRYPDKTKSIYNYDAAGNLIGETNPDGEIHEYTYTDNNYVWGENHNGLATYYEYYPNGKVKKAAYSDGTSKTYTYDCHWNVIQVMDQDKSITHYDYDIYGNVTDITDALQNTVHYEYDKYGRKILEQDANGNETRYKYDGNGNCVETTNPYGLVTEMSYDAVGNLKTVTAHTKKGDLTVSYEYDRMNRVTGTTDARGNTTRVTYDAHGNIKELYDAYGDLIQNNTYDAIDQLTGVKTISGKTTQYTYDNAGHVEKIVECPDTELQSEYNYEYDKESGKLTKVTDPQNKVTNYGYDNRGNLGAVTEPEGNTTSYGYDKYDRLTEEKTDFGVIASYSYNAKGLLAEEMNGRQQKTTYVYDAIGRISSKTDALGKVEYGYDDAGNILTVKDKNGTITRTYDAMNNVKTVTDYNGNTISYNYDQLGNRIEINYPGGEIVRYTYDPNGNIETVTDGAGKVTTYTYDKNNRLTQTKRADGTTETRTYDKEGQLTALTDKNAAGEIIHDYCYEYDQKGNITAAAGMEKGDTSLLNHVRMTYDKDNRLDTYNGKQVKYDADGNMTHGPLNGRMADFTYDCRNRLIKVTEEDGTVTEYEYDAENTRTATIKDGIKTVYVTDKEATYSQILKETDYKYSALTGRGQKISEKTYTYGAGLISERRNTQDAGRNDVQGSAQNNKETFYYHYNHLGSTTAVTDKSGNIVYKFAYGTYGELTAVTDKTGNSLIQPEEGKTIQECLNGAATETGITFLYNGQYGVTTEADGLYYMRARYYNTDTKRFINRDTVKGDPANPKSLNRYSYVQGNPVSLTDPFGLSPAGGGGGGGGGGFSATAHAVLDVIGIFWDGADIINGIWYALEGDYFMAATCALSALPVFGSMAGGAAKLVMKNARTANKVSNCIQSVSKVMSFTATATMSAIDTGYAVSDAYTAAKNGNLTVGAVGSVVLNATATVLAGAATVGSVTKAADAISSLRSEPINHAMSGVSASTSKLHNDVRSGNEVGLGNGNTVGVNAKDATVGNKAKDVVKGQGDTYYHSCGDNVADIIAETGFRTDIPDKISAFHNNRYGRGVYLADTPITALAERPNGTILKVSANIGKNLDISYRGIIGGDNYALTHAVARGARKHGYDSITFSSAKNPMGINTVVFDPVKVLVEEVMR